jgi:three-Cys-motif partner protein
VAQGLVVTQGQSTATPFKMLGIVAAAVGIGAKIHGAKFGQKYPFWLFDLFCGTGYNERADCIGSPIAMYREAVRCGVAPLMHCVDRDPEALSILSAESLVIENFDKRIFLHNGDNAEFHVLAFERVRERENPQYAHGIALFDPNDSVINLELLAGFSRLLPGVDIVINYSGAAIKRANGAGANRADLRAYLEAADKKHWLIRRPLGIWQWSLLIGRNIPTGDYRAIGFEHLDGSAGKAALQSLLLTRSDFANASGQSTLGL